MPTVYESWVPTNYVSRSLHSSGPQFLWLLGGVNWIISSVSSNLNILWLQRTMRKVDNPPEMETLGEETSEDKSLWLIEVQKGVCAGVFWERTTLLTRDYERRITKISWWVGWGILVDTLARGWWAGYWVWGYSLRILSLCFGSRRK